MWMFVCVWIGFLVLGMLKIPLIPEINKREDKTLAYSSYFRQTQKGVCEAQYYTDHRCSY